MKKFNIKREKHKLWIRQHKWQIIKWGTLCLSIVFLGIAIMYYTQASFSTRVTFDVIDAKVAPFSTGDVVLTYNIDGVDSNSIMENDGTTYRLSNYTCDNQEVLEWDHETWKIIIGNMSVKVKCKLYFETAIKIIYDANDGSVSPTSVVIAPGGTISSLPTPTRKGSTTYSFDGWYTSSIGGNEITTSTTFNSSQTIYAHWTKTGCYRISNNGNYEAHYNASGQMDACYFRGCQSLGCSNVSVNNGIITGTTYSNGTGTMCDGGSNNYHATLLCYANSSGGGSLISLDFGCNETLLPKISVYNGGLTETYTCP